MISFLIILFFQCRGCCVRPDGSAGSCAGDPSRCADCDPPPPLSIDNYLLIFFAIALLYGIWLLSKDHTTKVS